MLSEKSDSRIAQFSSNGYFCLKDDGSPFLQGETNEDGVTLHVSCDDKVQIDKMFGPLIFFPIRVRADFRSGEWIVERLHGDDDEWHEYARIPGQRDEDFSHVE